jgi:predicted nucleic acid-binding protein
VGSVIPFSQAKIFVQSLTKDGHVTRAILDTNILIAGTYEINKEHESVSALLDTLTKLGVEFYATVNTRAEFIEFHRRLLLTEILLDLIDEHSKIKMPNAARSEIKTAYASVKSKQSRDGADPIFNDDPKQAHLFTQTLDWPVAAAIVEKTGLSISDSMIMNALNSSVCDFAISLDFDFGFATLADSKAKDVVMPDRAEREYRHYHFDIL